MSTFVMPKSSSDVEEKEIWPKDWYIMELMKEPYRAKNNALKAMEEAQEKSEDVDDELAAKAGHNIVFELRSVDNEPQFNGELFTKYLPDFNEGDDERPGFTMKTREDDKVADLTAYAEAFNPDAEVDDEVGFQVGRKAQFMVQPGIWQGRERNELDMNVHPRPVVD